MTMNLRGSAGIWFIEGREAAGCGDWACLPLGLEPFGAWLGDGAGAEGVVTAGLILELNG